MIFYDPDLLALIDELWQENPEQRLGQLLLNLTRDNGSVSSNKLWNATYDDFTEGIA